MSVMLTLDGEAISLDNMKVAVSANLADTDVSGRSAQTVTAEQGNKAIELKITGTLKFTAESVATRLFELSRMTEKDGSRKVFRIGNGTARVVKCRLVKFAGQLSLTEQSNLLAWQVAFSLKEVRSVAEQQELRTMQQPKASQQLNQAQFSQALAASNKVAL
ncbi:DNA-binding protein [Shewanella algae]|uniref:baseplate complex protein n=1 Tax=Shewanella algae TaxID=38313 RepID=UPI001AACF5AA|nr:DNA-binding protein [Shewanella algae]MBO2604295.1 DNA-binding protein [Shewanella algae]